MTCMSASTSDRSTTCPLPLRRASHSAAMAPNAPSVPVSSSVSATGGSSGCPPASPLIAA